MVHCNRIFSCFDVAAWKVKSMLNMFIVALLLQFNLHRGLIPGTRAKAAGTVVLRFLHITLMLILCMCLTAFDGQQAWTAFYERGTSGCEYYHVEEKASKAVEAGLTVTGVFQQATRCSA